MEGSYCRESPTHTHTHTHTHTPTHPTQPNLTQPNPPHPKKGVGTKEEVSSHYGPRLAIKKATKNNKPSK